MREMKLNLCILRMLEDTFSLGVLFQIVMKNIERERKDLLKSEQVEMYIQRCTEICWLMAIQDPPMALYLKLDKNAKYEKSLYREFTKHGNFVDYIVWPAVLIQDGGSLMCKGIVQCRNGNDMSSSDCDTVRIIIPEEQESLIRI